MANDDVGIPVNGYIGGTSFNNVLTNDTLNGVIITTSNLVTITYTSTNPGITLIGTDVVVAAGTPAGNYTLEYTICSKSTTCSCDSATVNITVTALAIIAQNDTITDIDGALGNVNIGNVLNNNGNGNDTLNGSNASIDQVIVTIKTPATSIGGSPIPVVDTTTGQISVPPGTAAGTYTIVYQICESVNQNNCDEAIVTIDVAVVLACRNLLVHNAFSPNGDGTNELFNIENITDECYINNTVEIYNRWGVLVFETKNYNNETNAFDGTSSGRTTVKQSEGLPTGTYFYILNYTESTSSGTQTFTKNGYLYLTR